MEFVDVLYSRKSIRKYKMQDVPDEDIRKVVDAARIAPSGKNCQNWHFVVLKNRIIIEKLRQVIQKENRTIVNRMKEIDVEKAERFEKFCNHFTLFIDKAPVVILTFAKTYYPSGYFEKKLCGESEAILQELVLKANPGMQSVGAAMEHMALTATNMNYGTCWLTSANYAGEAIEKMLESATGFEKEGYFFAGMMTLGIPEAGEHKSPGRKSFEDICTFIV